MDTKIYLDLLDVLVQASKAGISGVIVFKPEAQVSEEDQADMPDMILCTSSEPKVIAALLGNYYGDDEQQTDGVESAPLQEG